MAGPRQRNSLTLAQLHAAVKLADRTEALLDEMKAMRWVAKAGRGWMLVRDASDLSVAEVYHLFVFRAGTKQPARQAGPELDALARHLEARIEEIMHLSVEELFRRSAPSVPGLVSAHHAGDRGIVPVALPGALDQGGLPGRPRLPL